MALDDFGPLSSRCQPEEWLATLGGTNETHVTHVFRGTGLQQYKQVCISADGLIMHRTTLGTWTWSPRLRPSIDRWKIVLTP